MRDYGDNIGGIHAAWLGLAATTLGSFPIGGTGTSIGAAALDNMEQIPIHPFRASFRQSVNDTDQGALYPKTFDTGIPSDSETVRELILKYEGKDTVLIYQDLDFNHWMVFDKAEPGKFLSEFASGMDPNEGKLHTLTISNPGTWPRHKLTVI